MNSFATTKNLTIIGIAMIVQSLATAALYAFDGNPDTVVDWGGLANSLIAGIGLILAKGAATTGPQTVTGKPVA